MACHGAQCHTDCKDNRDELNDITDMLCQLCRVCEREALHSYNLMYGVPRVLLWWSERKKMDKEKFRNQGAGHVDANSPESSGDG